LSGAGALQASTPPDRLTPPCSSVSTLFWAQRSCGRPMRPTNADFLSGSFFTADVGHRSAYRDTAFATTGHVLCALRTWSPLITSSLDARLVARYGSRRCDDVGGSTWRLLRMMHSSFGGCARARRSPKLTGKPLTLLCS
jgi:hypothetical protein